MECKVEDKIRNGITNKILENKEKANSLFKEEVIFNGEINISSDLITEYKAKLPGNGKSFLESIRQNHLKYYNSNSTNIDKDYLWLTDPILGTLTNKNLVDFLLKINPNANIGVVDSLDQKAISLIRDYIIIIEKGHLVTELPQEVSHFFVELLPDDSQLKKSLLKEVLNHPIYAETLDKYKNDPSYQIEGRINYDKIKKEAAATLIGRVINETYTESKKHSNKLLELIDKIIKFLRKAITLAKPTRFYEPIIASNNPFREAADRILNGDTAELNVSKIPTIYDSVFYSLAEENSPESFNTKQLVKAFYEFSNSTSTELNKLFNKYLSDNAYESLKELKDLLEEDTFHSALKHNKIFESINSLSELKKILRGFREQNIDLQTLTDAAKGIGDIFHQMDSIAIALNKILKFWNRADSTELDVINNIKELQHYKTFVDRFKKMNADLDNLLASISNNYPEEEKLTKLIDTLQEERGSANNLFEGANLGIIKKLQKYLLSLAKSTVQELYDENTKDFVDRFSKLKLDITKERLLKQFQDLAADPLLLDYVMFGRIDRNEKIITIPDPTDSTKTIEIKANKLKDISEWDMFKFLVGPTSTVNNAFVATAMKQYISYSLEASVKTSQEQQLLGMKYMPIFEQLSNQGISLMDAMKAIQREAEFYSQDGNVKHRVLQSQTFRQEFLLEKKQLNLAVEKAIDKYQSNEDNLKKQELFDAIKIAKENLEKFDEEFSIREYSDDFYSRLKTLKSKNISSITKNEIKNLERQIISKEDDINIIEITLDNIDELDRMYQEINVLREKLNDLLYKINPEDKVDYEEYKNLYEEDLLKTERVAHNHYIKWRNKFLNKTKNEYSELDLQYMYTNKYRVLKNSEEFRQEEKILFEDLNLLTSNLPKSSGIAKKIDALYADKYRMTTVLRSINGYISIGSLKELKDIDGLLFSDKLKFNEEESQRLKRVLRLVSLMERNELSDSLVKDATDFLDFGYAINLAKIKNQEIEILQILQNINPNITESFVNRLIQAVSLMEEDNSELLNIRNEFTKDVSSQLKGLINTLIDKTINKKELLERYDKIIFSNYLMGNQYDTELENDIKSVFSSIDEMSDKVVQQQYIDFLKEFNIYVGDYIVSVPPDSVSQKYAIEKLNYFRENEANDTIFLVDVVEEYFSGGFFDTILNHIYPRDEENTEERFIAFENLAFNLHKRNTDSETLAVTVRPLNYLLKKKSTDNTQVIWDYPNFLKRNKVKDNFLTSRNNVTQEGEETVDMMGNFLPKVIKGNKFYNDKYDDIKNNPSLFALLQEFTKDFTTLQLRVEEFRRHDLVFPSFQRNKAEKLSAQTSSVKDFFESIFKDGLFSKASSSQANNYFEEQGLSTIQEVGIYSGIKTDTHSVRLESLRKTPIQLQSKDFLSSLLYYIDDLNDFDFKNSVEPIFKAYSEVFEHIYNTTSTQKKLADVFDKLTKTKIYGETPDSFFNNPVLKKMLSILNNVSTMRLLADPLGAIINLVGGEVQHLIQAGLNPKELASYFATGLEANRWSAIYTKNDWTKAKLDRTTQIVDAFHMLPDTKEIEKQFNLVGKLGDVKSLLMQPRTVTEYQIGIHQGLAVIRANKITIKNKDGVESEEYIDNLYEIGSNGLIQVKKSIDLIKIKDNWEEPEKYLNPLNGELVKDLRLKIFQKFTLLQGNFFKQNQSYASNFALGKSMELMKRWFVSGMLNRIGAPYLDIIGEEKKIPHYTAFVHSIVDLYKALRSEDAGAFNDVFKEIIWKDSIRKQALSKMLMEVMYTMMFAMIVLLLGYNSDDPDKNKKLKEMSHMRKILILLAMRMNSEAGTYIPLPIWGLGYMELKRAIFNPFSLMSSAGDNLFGGGALILMQIMNATGIENFDKQLFYQKDSGYWYKEKGDSKLFAYMLNTIGYTGYTAEPDQYIKTLNQLSQRMK